MASDEIGKAIKDARIAAGFAAFCVLLVGLLLLIDGRRNKWMADQINEVRRIFGEFQVMAGGMVRDAGYEPQASGSASVGGGAADGGGTGGDSGSGVVADGAAGAGVAETGSAGTVPVNGSGSRRAGMAGGPRGDG